MAANRVRTAIDRLRRWNARSAVWRTAHPWWSAAVFTAVLLLVDGLLYTTLRQSSFGRTAEYAVTIFLVAGVAEMLRSWRRRKAGAEGQAR